MTRDEAAEYIPQWGSLMRSGDPGYIAYTAIPPERPEHRDDMVAWLRGCLPRAEGEDVGLLGEAIAYLNNLDLSGQGEKSC